MTFDSEDAEMYYIAEDMKWDLIRPGEYDEDQADLFVSLSLTTQPPSLWLTMNGEPNTRRWMLAKNSNELRRTDSKAKICRS